MSEKQTPLHELLLRIPDDIRIGVSDGEGWQAGMAWHPVGAMCHEAAAELIRLHAANAEMLEALRDCVKWYGNRTNDDFSNDDSLRPIDQQPPEIQRAMRAIAKATAEPTTTSSTRCDTAVIKQEQEKS